MSAGFFGLVCSVSHTCGFMRCLSARPDGRAFEFGGYAVLSGTTGSYCRFRHYNSLVLPQCDLPWGAILSHHALCHFELCRTFC